MILSLYRMEILWEERGESSEEIEEREREK
jgi:hypothetical protein